MPALQNLAVVLKTDTITKESAKPPGPFCRLAGKRGYHYEEEGGHKIEEESIGPRIDTGTTRSSPHPGRAEKRTPSGYAATGPAGTVFPQMGGEQPTGRRPFVPPPDPADFPADTVHRRQIKRGAGS